MAEALTLLFALGAGGALGALFFGGLWWTVTRAVSSSLPALWFSASLLLRIGAALLGFYIVSGGHWERLFSCLIGFFIARRVVTGWAGSPIGAPTPSVREASHAPEP